MKDMLGRPIRLNDYCLYIQGIHTRRVCYVKGFTLHMVRVEYKHWNNYITSLSYSTKLLVLNLALNERLIVDKGLERLNKDKNFDQIPINIENNTIETKPLKLKDIEWK